MVKDLNKRISMIEYNFLNLPRRITFTGVNNPVNEYVYSSGGKKLSVIHKSSTEKRTDYVGNMIYENGSLKRILVDGGYIENGIYHFYLQDHLGNNRVVWPSLMELLSKRLIIILMVCLSQRVPLRTSSLISITARSWIRRMD